MKKTLLLLGLALALPAAFAAKGKDLFKAMDANRDGRISAGEHAAGAKGMFQKMDANHDGKVTADEMDRAQPSVTGKKASQAAMSSADKIKAVDADGDGVLTAKEHEAGSRIMFDKMDANHDGKLSRGEFTAGHKRIS